MKKAERKKMLFFIINLLLIIVIFISIYFILRNLISHVCAKHILKKISE